MASTKKRRFMFFSHLPPEIRVQIWQYTLPDLSRRALYHFHPSLRKVKRVTRSYPRHIRYSANLNNSTNSDTSVPSRPEKLDRPLHLPIASVNSEARQIALSWATKNSTRVRQVYGRGFVQRFDPSHDVLLVDRIYSHFYRYDDRSFIEPEFTRTRPDFHPERIAFDESVLYNAMIDVDGLLDCLGGNGILYIICTHLKQVHDRPRDWSDIYRGSPPTWYSSDISRWEIGSAVGGLYKWNADAKYFDFECGGSAGLEEKLPKAWMFRGGQLVQDTVTLQDGINGMLALIAGVLSARGRSVNGFEVRPVRVVP